jgi:PIN domain nuclease of toxin-antitoxin system
MRILLDTHTYHWYLAADPRLSVQAQTMIQNSANNVLVSPASLWEMAIKISLGKWSLSRPYLELVNLGLITYGFNLIPIIPAHTARLLDLPYPNGHKDPFDRLLVAQALTENIPIISCDTIFDSYGVVRLW